MNIKQVPCSRLRCGEARPRPIPARKTQPRSYMPKAASVFDALSATVFYCEFSTQRLDADLGTEVDVQLQAKVQRFSGLIKYAAYEAHEGRTPAAYQDTTKVWLQLEYVW